MSEQQEESSGLSVELREEYREAFNIFDRNGDGNISSQELGTVMRSLGANPTEDEVSKLIAEIDENGSGTVEFDEFCKMMKARGKTPEDEKSELRNSFKLFDKDNSGFIEANEFRQVMSKLSHVVSDEDIEEMIKIADINHDGKLDIDEFVKALSS